MHARSLAALYLACSLVAPAAAQPASGPRALADELARAEELLASGDSTGALELALRELEQDVALELADGRVRAWVLFAGDE